MTNTDHIDEIDPIPPKEYAKRQFLGYPFPLDDGRAAQLLLPIDITRHEADRLMAMVDTLPLPR